MEAMAIDGEVNADVHSQQLALIRAVRTLDDDTSSPLPDKIHKLWLLLAAAKRTRLYAVEETVLRWLLKQMGGNTDAAEQSRRYPLTWTVLAHVFPKIPAQALGRTLAYTRFVSILNKTLRDITAPEIWTSTPGNQEDAMTAKKRKRGAGLPATLAELRTPTACLRTASEVFTSVAILLEQGTALSGEVTPEKRVGAEHIKSLFSSSSDDTRDITARLLLICDHSLSLPDVDFVKGQQAWIDTLTAVWNLRLHSKEDSLEFAKHAYERVSLTLAKVEEDDSTHPRNHIYSTCRDIWASQLRRFLGAYFIRPARQRFTQDKNIDMLKLALQIAQKDVVASTTAMWSIAARTPRDTSDPKSKIEHDAWIETIFQVVVEGLKPLTRQKKNEVLSRLLDVALQTRSIPYTETLRELYQQHNPDGADIDWTLLSKILACDAEVFLLAETPGAIFDIISKVSSSDTKTSNHVVDNVIIPLQGAYSNARNLARFITHWFKNLGAAESVMQSIWFDQKIRQHLATLIQPSFTGSQLLRLLEDLESTPSKAGEVLVVLDGICAGITDENIIAIIQSKLFSIMDQIWGDISPEVLALRWRIFGFLASWESSDECKKIWKKVKSDLKPILKKGSLTGTETFEAFSCCYKLCLANHIGGKYEEDLNKLTCSMVERLIKSAKIEADLETLKLYVDLVFNHLPRLSEQPKQEVNTLTDQLVKLLWSVSYKLPSIPTQQRLNYVQPLIENCDVADEEPMVDALIAPFLDTLDNSGKKCGWTQPQSLDLLSILLEFPVESWTRGRRKRMMASWKKHKSTINSHAAKYPSYTLAVLRLLVKIMQQPTFYEDMKFLDISDVCSETIIGNDILLCLAEKLVDTTIRQVFANPNDLTESYLCDAYKYTENPKLGQGAIAYTQILILKCLAAVVKEHKASHESWRKFGVKPDAFGKTLAKLVKEALDEFVSKSKAPLPEEWLRLLPLVLDAAQVISDDAGSETKIELSDDTVTLLERVGDTALLGNSAAVWKLRSFLIKQRPNRHTAASLSAFLDEGVEGVSDEIIYGFVGAYTQGKSRSAQDQLIGELMARDKLTGGSIGSLLAAQRLLELYPAPNGSDQSADTPKSLDLAKIHEHYTSHLSRTNSLPHFKQISETMLFLLDKHAASMKQHNIEATLTAVVEVCSAHGPKIEGPKAAGEIYSSLFKVVALIIKRHRVRLSGHFHILLKTLRALLSVLLADPSSSSSSSATASRRGTASTHPPWLQTRLAPRHGERFARLLTLICEPSAASVARARSHTALDSATDVAKRAAGMHMYLVLEVYIKLQLQGEVSREMRKALEVGFYSVLDITGKGRRRVLNESLDVGGRALFKALFAEWRTFGGWKGV
ncbi:Urb2/Npa2 family-domain-containing protein [Astrocystis sublimbata]|nr:Urb2/Npa2 family-domain-containing protein [Astrocystis sublimbata]